MADTHPQAQQVQALALELGRELTPGQASQLALYLGLLVAWNRRANLVGPRTWPEMLAQLVADSWHLADLVSELALPQDPLTLDFGAGAGLPGIPLRVFWTAGRYVMIEPRAKRAAFLRQSLAMMRLAGTEAFEGRYEALPLRADLCVSRAFQPWRTFLATAQKFGRARAQNDFAVPGDPGVRLLNAPVTIVFANAKSPDEPLPEGWKLHAVREYPRFEGVGKPREPGYFWVFSPVSTPS